MSENEEKDPPGPNEEGYVDFIYAGPWIENPLESPFINAVTPRNVHLRGIFRRSFAYKTLKDRIPVILTKVVDTLSRKGGMSDAVADISQLKSELMTNKMMTPFEDEESDEAKYWNKCIEAMDKPFYFTNVWVYSECYVYRRIYEAVGRNFDPFKQQKHEAFEQNLQASCLAAQSLNDFVNSEDDKENIVTLLKLCLWSNKCDLSLSANPQEIVDPVAMIDKLKPNLLADDTNKAADFILERCAAYQRRIDEEKTEEEKVEEEAEPEFDPDNPNPCPSKITYAPKVTFDIVCDNAAYELVADLCLGYFLLKRGIVQKVRYHVKAMPWFVSDVTPDDFDWVVDQCASADYTKEPTEEEENEGGDMRVITSEFLNSLGEGIKEYMDSGAITVESDRFWTTPTLYKDMKKLDEAMYRKLQYPACIVFKGDLNYRKLVGETNWPPTYGFDKALQGFNPAPIVAIRTVKCDLICGLPKNKWEQLTKADPEWMEKGDYGVIQFSTKKEDPKVLNKPCPQYGETCKGHCK